MAIEGAGGEEWLSFVKLGGYDPRLWQERLNAARQRIPAIRQRDVRLRLVDHHGAPLARTTIDVEQVGSDFQWGFCGWGLLNQLDDGSFDNMPQVHTRRLQQNLFNAINLMHYWAERNCDNAPQSEEYLGHVDYDLLDQAVTWARGNGLAAKGHPLYWPVPKALPAWLARYDLETRRRFLEVRIRQITARFRGRIQVYDAVNEMMWEPTLAHTATRHWPHLERIEDVADEAAQVLTWARDEDPGARYLLNEYGIGRGDHKPVPVPANTGETITHDQQLDRFIALGQHLVDRGQAPDALGIQSLPGDWNDIAMLDDTISAIGESTALPVHITEARTSTKHLGDMPRPEALERFADYAEAVVTVCFGNPHLEAFYFWGSWDLIERRKPTPVYQRLYQLIHERWRTRCTVTSDDEGRIAFTGYTGQYQLHLRHPGGRIGAWPLQVPASLVGGLDCDLRIPGWQADHKS